MATLNDMVEHCDCCGEELELGQIGECDECQSERDDAQVDFASVEPQPFGGTENARINSRHEPQHRH